MTAVTPEISEAEAQRRDTAAKKMNSQHSRIKNVRTRLENLAEGIDKDSPEFLEFQAQVAEIVGLAPSTPDEVVVESDAEALAILRESYAETRDLDEIINGLDAEIKEQVRLYQIASSEGIRNYHGGRVRTLAELIPVVQAAKKLPEGKRTFGCRTHPRLKVSGRDSIFPDAQFSFHTLTTDDPLLISRLLLYTEKGEWPLIETRRNGDVALVNHESGNFGQWVTASEAEDVIRSMGGTVRRPFR